jgi:hypothetical protein
VSYEPDEDAKSGLFSNMSGKKLALLAVIIVIGGFFGVREGLILFTGNDSSRYASVAVKNTTKRTFLSFCAADNIFLY